MNSKKMTEYKNRLQEIRNELVGDVEKNLKSSQAESSQNVPDISDEAARDYNSELMLNLGQQDWVNIKFNRKDYLLSCDDGQEENLKKLASHLDKKFNELKSNLGNTVFANNVRSQFLRLD